MTTTILVGKHKSYRVEGELPNGAFYLVGPRGGVSFAKPLRRTGNAYVIEDMRGNALHCNGELVLVTREQLEGK